MKNEWSATDTETLERLWSEGIPSGKIGESVNRSRDAVTDKARRMGLPRRPNPAISHLDNFAESLSEHGNVENAGKACGLKMARAKKQFDRLCTKVGPQALGTWRVKWPPDSANP